jgi:hypothetical protein
MSETLRLLNSEEFLRLDRPKTYLCWKFKQVRVIPNSWETLQAVNQSNNLGNQLGYKFSLMEICNNIPNNVQK